MMSIIIAIFVAFLDQIIKIIIDKKVLFIEIIPNFFNLHKVYNYGVAFSFLENNRLLILLLSFILIYFLFNLQKEFKNNKKYDILFGVVYGGILGNLIDRIFKGYVIDYLEFFIFGYSFPIFNLADINITIGIILIGILMTLGEKKK